eukprot:gene36424-59528_t
MKGPRDKGVSTIVVVLAIPFLMLASALVFDVGRLYIAGSDARNAADAGALAKATDCALGDATTEFAPYETNGAALSNSPVCGTGTTTVSMQKTIDLAFALMDDRGEATGGLVVLPSW